MRPKQILLPAAVMWLTWMLLLLATACEKTDGPLFTPGPPAADGMALLELGAEDGPYIEARAAWGGAPFPFYYRGLTQERKFVFGLMEAGGPVWEKASGINRGELLVLSSPGTAIDRALLACGRESGQVFDAPWQVSIYSPAGNLLISKPMPGVSNSTTVKSMQQVPISPAALKQHFAALNIAAPGLNFDIEVFMVIANVVPGLPDRVSFFAIQYAPAVDVVELPGWIAAPPVELPRIQGLQHNIFRMAQASNTSALQPQIPGCSASGAWRDSIQYYATGYSYTTRKLAFAANLVVGAVANYRIEQCILSSLTLQLEPRIQWHTQLPSATSLVPHEFAYTLVKEPGVLPDWYVVMNPQGPGRILIFKLNASGSILWEVSFPLHDINLFMLSVPTALDDTHLWVGGRVYPAFLSDSKGYIAKVNKHTGAFVSHRVFGDGVVPRNIEHLVSEGDRLHLWGGKDLPIERGWYARMDKASF